MFQNYWRGMKNWSYINTVNKIEKKPQEIEGGSKCINHEFKSTGFGVNQAALTSLV